MAKSESEKLLQETKNTEQAVTSVTQLGDAQGSDFLLFGDLPEPPPPIQGPTQSQPKQSDEQESEANEMQDAWLVSHEARIKLLEAKASAAVKHAEADGKLTDNALRKDMADKTFSFMEKWCVFVGLVIFIYVAKHEGDPPKEVILALLGTCTVSIIGLVGFVVSGLFKSSKQENK